MENQKLLRFSSALLFFGSLLLYVGEYFHNGHLDMIFRKESIS